MKLSYRQATELTGMGGAVYRGRILNKILTGFYGQPEIKAKTYKAIALGLSYILAVVLLAALVVPVGSKFIFGFLGGLAGLYFIVYLTPFKYFPLYQAGKMDEQYDVDEKE